MRLLLFISFLLFSVMAAAQNLSADRVDKLAYAISRAEGFGLRGTIPTRYHNPGDIKVVRGVRFPGQRGIGKGGHVIFRTDVDGWAALKNQIVKMANGNSSFYNPDMTIMQVARKYATNHRPWAKRVAFELGV